MVGPERRRRKNGTRGEVPKDLHAAIQGSIQELLQLACGSEIGKPVLLRSLGHFIEDSEDAQQLHTSLRRAASGSRAVYPPPWHYQPGVDGTGVNLVGGPTMARPSHAEALWLIDDVINELSDMRSNLERENSIAKSDPKATTKGEGDDPEATTKGEGDDSDGDFETDFYLIQQLSHILNQRGHLKRDSIDRSKRHFVLNCIAVVAILQLPAVMRHLRDEKRLRADLVDEFFQPLVGDDLSCLAAIVRARYVDLGERIQNMEDAANDCIRAWRIQGAQSKWVSTDEFLAEIGIWSPKQSDGNPDSLRSDYQRGGASYLGDLSQQQAQIRVWRRVARFMGLVDLASLSVNDLRQAHFSISSTLEE